MNNELIIQKAIEEIVNKNFGATEQFLAIHEIVYVDNKPKIERIDTDKADGTVIVYFSVLKEKFYLAVYLDTKPEITVRFVDTEDYNAVYFSATSETLNLEQLSSLTTLKPTNGWNKGDKKKYGNSYYTFTKFMYEPNPEPDEFDDKLNKLLTLLEKDEDGIRKLVNDAHGYIQVATEFHNGNNMLGRFNLAKETIHRMSNLNLEIDFDLYTSGNFFKD